MGPSLPGTSTPSAQRARQAPAPPLPNTARAASFSAGACGGTDRQCPTGISGASAPRCSRSCSGCPPHGASARVATLLVLDFVGVGLAIFTALVLKEAFHGNLEASRAYEGTKQFLPFAYLLTALLFARSGLYAERAIRPGLSRIVGSLFQVAFVALLFAVVNGEHFSSYYLFYGSLAFAIFYVSMFRGRLRAGHGHRPAGSRLSAPRGPGRQRKAHRRCRPRDPGRAALADRDRRFPRARTPGGERAAPLGSLGDLPQLLSSTPVDELIIADPDFPRTMRWSSSTNATAEASGCAWRRRRWRY